MKIILIIFYIFYFNAFASDFEDGTIALEEKKYEKALQLLKKSCNDLNPEACFQVGNIYFEGLGVQDSDFEAKSYYLKACKLKLQEACQAADDLDPG